MSDILFVFGPIGCGGVFITWANPQNFTGNVQNHIKKLNSKLVLRDIKILKIPRSLASHFQCRNCKMELLQFQYRTPIFLMSRGKKLHFEPEFCTLVYADWYTHPVVSPNVSEIRCSYTRQKIVLLRPMLHSTISFSFLSLFIHSPADSTVVQLSKYT